MSLFREIKNTFLQRSTPQYSHALMDLPQAESKWLILHQALVGHLH